MVTAGLTVVIALLGLSAIYVGIAIAFGIGARIGDAVQRLMQIADKMNDKFRSFIAGKRRILLEIAFFLLRQDVLEHHKRRNGAASVCSFRAVARFAVIVLAERYVHEMPVRRFGTFARLDTPDRVRPKSDADHRFAVMRRRVQEAVNFISRLRRQ